MGDAQRMNLSVATGPNPPWTGVVFDCELCGAKYQLGASDDCQPLPGDTFADAACFLAPPCWGNPRENFACGHRNTIRTPRFEPEGNPS